MGVAAPVQAPPAAMPAGSFTFEQQMMLLNARERAALAERAPLPDVAGSGTGLGSLLLAPPAAPPTVPLLAAQR